MYNLNSTSGINHLNRDRRDSDDITDLDGINDLNHLSRGLAGDLDGLSFISGGGG